MASMDRLPSGKWRARVYIGKNEAGKPVYRTITADKQSELKQLVGQYERDIADGLNKPAAGITFATAAREWLTLKTLTIRGRTSLDYKRIIDGSLIPAFGDRVISKIHEREIRAWLAQRISDSSGNTARKHLAVLRTILADTLRDRSPAKHIPLPPLTVYEADPPGITETASIMAVFAGTPDELILRLIVDGGFREGEIFALTYGAALAIPGKIAITQALSLNEDGVYEIEDPKSRRGRRSVAVPPALQTSIWALLAAQGADTRNGSYLPSEWKDRLLFNIRPDSFGKRFSAVLARHNGYFDGEGQRLPNSPDSFKRTGCTYHIQQCPLKICRFYDLRHHNASRLLAAKLPDKYVAQRLGHDPNVLRRTYQHLFVEVQDELDAATVALLSGDIQTPENGNE